MKEADEVIVLYKLRSCVGSFNELQEKRVVNTTVALSDSWEQ